MATNRRGKRGLGRGWRIAMWGGAAALLLLPYAAMQFTDEVAWDLADFIIFGVMLAGACVTLEVAARMTGNSAYRAAAGVAVGTAFLLVWMNLAVGLIGSEDNPANLMYAGVLAVPVIGGCIVRFRAMGMAVALIATAIAQVVVVVIALAEGWGEALVLTAVFVALWLASAALFRRSAQDQANLAMTPPHARRPARDEGDAS